MRIVVSGVRSSCETSETNRCCTADSPSSWRIWDCRLSAMPLNDVARRARSSSPRTGIRSLSLPADRRWATPLARRTGVTTWRVTTQATAPTRMVRMMPATTKALPMRSIVATSCSIG